MEKGLSEKTIRTHMGNAGFYLNNYLLYEEPIPMEQGYADVDGFFGDFFIRKCMWSTPGTIKSTATSLKKFYKCMMEHGKLDKDAYSDLCETIKYQMEEWQELCENFNDPSQENPFHFFF